MKLFLRIALLLGAGLMTVGCSMNASIEDFDSIKFPTLMLKQQVTPVSGARTRATTLRGYSVTQVVGNVWSKPTVVTTPRGYKANVGVIVK